MKRWMALLLMAFVTVASWALPTVDQVQAEVAKGNYAAAEVMMRDVLAERPKSARAHYVLAEILAHNGRLDDARQEAKRARELDPAISFTPREKFEDFERALARGGRPAAGVAPSRMANPSPGVVERPVAPAPAARSSGVPGWLWGVGGAVIAVLLFRMLARRRAAAAEPMAGWGGQAGAGAGMGGMAGGSPSRSGLLGAGLAGAGGFAAGMLAERLLHGDRDSGNPAGGGGAALSDGGGDDEFSRRSIDFGSGGNDWGSDAGGGGSSDGGGGGDW